MRRNTRIQTERFGCGVEHTADGVTIIVADSGIGIPPEATARLFDMFSQVKSAQDRSEGGLGIGLALTKGLVELHGGRIEARSAGVGCGSEFIVWLPHQGRQMNQRHLQSPVGTERPPPSRRILIADDNRDAAESLAMLLQMENHEVRVVNDGQAALAAFAEFQPEVALLDIGMPALNGYEVARSIRRKRGPAVTLIAVTGWGQERDKANALFAGFNYHFTKPVDLDQIMDILRSLEGK